MYFSLCSDLQSNLNTSTYKDFVFNRCFFYSIVSEFSLDYRYFEDLVSDESKTKQKTGTLFLILELFCLLLSQ